MSQLQPQAPSVFTPTWRYNPIKHELQFWHSPVQCLVFAESFLKYLAQEGDWRGVDHKSLSTLPISTR